MLIAYFFGEEDDDGYLPFAWNNAVGMKEVFQKAKVEGQRYDIAGPYGDMSKAQLFSAIDRQFANATQDDVSILYICAHGYASFGVSGEYAFAVDRTHFVTGSELMSRLEKIPGKVVLVLDSCHSGGFIDTNATRLESENGRIAVIASSHRSTVSSYWNVTQRQTSVDFYTYALLQGFGFNEAEGIGGARGWIANAGLYADQLGDGDGQVTLREWFDFAYTQTVELVKKWKNQAQFRGSSTQVPQSFFGALMDLVLFG